MTTVQATPSTQAFTKVVRVGLVPVYPGTDRRANLFCKIEYSAEGRLSISGVIGPKPNGDAQGGCGQIDMEFAHRNPADDDRRHSEPVRPEEITFSDDWSTGIWLHFLDVWHRWHLNDMRASCEHQRELGWGEIAKGKVTLYYWQLKAETRKAVRDAVAAATVRLKAGETLKLSDEMLPVAALPDRVTTWKETPPGPLYEPVARTTYSRPSEEKTLGWLRPTEHPRGILCKPCPVCGYEYGSAWRKEEVPGEVLSFLRQLPDTDRRPHWV
jgi:hypothetical protein